MKKILLGLICMTCASFANDASAMEKTSQPKPLVVVLLGPPGAGKGTVANPLSEMAHIPHISTGDLFRENIRGKTELGVEAKKYIDEGKLVPDQVVLNMLFDRIAKQDCARGFILDGFPRTIPQAKALDQKLQSSELVALHLKVPDSVLVERITGRIACKDCGKPYHKKYDPPKAKGICDDCKGSLYQRDDDREEILVKRLEVYHQQTQPLIEYYSKKDGVLREVDCEVPKEVVFEKVLEVLPLPTLVGTVKQ